MTMTPSRDAGVGVRWGYDGTSSHGSNLDGSVCLCGVLSALAAGVGVWVSVLRRGIVARARAASASARASLAPRPLSLTFHCLSRRSVDRRTTPAAVYPRPGFVLYLARPRFHTRLSAI